MKRRCEQNARNQAKQAIVCLANVVSHVRACDPLKCDFGVGSDKFLGFMVNQHRIEANPKMINALLEMSSPRKPKEVMSLVGKMASLSHFVS